MPYTVYYTGRQAPCPECGGAMRSHQEGEFFKCHDCGALFKRIGEGWAEREVTVKKIGKGATENEQRRETEE